jgi:hypothetical protein
MRKKFRNIRIASLAALVFAAGQILSPAVVIVPPPEKTMVLSWDYSELNPDVVFTIYHSEDPSLPRESWSVLTNVLATSCVVPLQPGEHYFAVTASNIVSGLKSGFN